MKSFYSNIANSNSTVGQGTRNSPYTWSQVLAVLADGTLADDITVYLKGTRTVSDIDIQLNDNDGTHIFNLQNWIETPYEVSASGGIEISCGDATTFKTPKETYVVGGIFIHTGDMDVEVLDSSTGNIFEFNNIFEKEN